MGGDAGENPFNVFRLFEFPIQSFDEAFLRLRPHGILLLDDSFIGTRKVASVSAVDIRNMVASKLKQLRRIAAIDDASSGIVVAPGRSLLVGVRGPASPIEIPMQYIRIRVFSS